jgi:NAD(P)H-nitrite reductase large subunit
MNRPKKGPKDRVVCFCYNVHEQTIIEAIRQGCTSVQDIRRTTYASTGCAGCSEEVKKLLRKFAVAKPEPAEGGGQSDPGKVSNG